VEQLNKSRHAGNSKHPALLFLFSSFSIFTIPPESWSHRTWESCIYSKQDSTGENSSATNLRDGQLRP